MGRELVALPFAASISPVRFTTPLLFVCWLAVGRFKPGPRHKIQSSIPPPGVPRMAKKIQDWLEADVRPFREKRISWVSQFHFFRDPIRPAYSDLSYFFSSANGIILYPRKVHPGECIVEIKGRSYSLRDAMRITAPRASQSAYS